MSTSLDEAKREEMSLSNWWNYNRPEDTDSIVFLTKDKFKVKIIILYHIF